jgi:hypothetical protein
MPNSLPLMAGGSRSQDKLLEVVGPYLNPPEHAYDSPADDGLISSCLWIMA